MKLGNIFKDKIILVTGGTGSIGSEIVKQLSDLEAKQIRVYARDEYKHFLLKSQIQSKKNIEYIIGDIGDRSRIQSAIKYCNYIFHTAAMKHVSYCEENPTEAIKTNILGAQIIFEAAIENNVEKVIGISTDKAVNPTTFMGKTKLIMEGLFTSQYSNWNNNKTIFSVVRLGNILNSKGSVVPLWIDQVDRGFDITITDRRMHRYLMAVEDATRSIIKAMTLSIGREIFVIKMREKNIYQLAQQVISEFGNQKKIKIKLIGRRYGEKLKEELLTREELSRSIETNNYYVVLPNIEEIKRRAKSYE